MPLRRSHVAPVAARARSNVRPLPPALVRATEVLSCPLCKRGLAPDGRTLRCEAGHRFDVTRAGSVRLDVPGAPRRPEGDHQRMVEARSAAFDRGVLRPMTAAIVDSAQAAGARCGGWMLDVGTGTGHHAAVVLDALASVNGIGVDVSRPALTAAARRHARLAAVGADVWRGLPLQDAAIDLALVVFAPRNAAELHRVLRPDGRLLVVTPRRSHLRELLDGAQIGVAHTSAGASLGNSRAISTQTTPSASSSALTSIPTRRPRRTTWDRGRVTG